MMGFENGYEPERPFCDCRNPECPLCDLDEVEDEEE